MSEFLAASHNISPKDLKAAIIDGINEGTADPAKQLKIKDLFNSSRPQLIDVIRDLNSVEDPLQTSRDFGLIGARILTLPAIKHPEGKMVSPANVQLLREILRSSIPRPLSRGAYRLEVSVGLGGSELPPSLRLPAYIQLALEIAEAFEDTSIPGPGVRVFNAHRISSSLNGLNPEIAQERANQASEFLQAYVERFYPNLKYGVRIEDLDSVEIEDNAKIFENDVDLLEDLFYSDLMSDSPQLNDQEQKAKVALEKLRRAASKHYTGSDTDMMSIVCGYAATHGIAFRNYGRALLTDGVIKVGGQGEAQFDVLQQFLASVHHRRGDIEVNNINIGHQPQLICLRNIAGGIPPYYPDSKELTVASAPSDIPASLKELKDHYKTQGLLSGSDFDCLPAHVQAELLDFFRDFIAGRQTV